MKIISKSQLMGDLSNLLQLIELEGEEVLVTDGNRPIITMSPYQKLIPTSDLFKDMRGKVKYLEDLTNPTTEEWQEI
ncbi:prevent-host-death protein [Roseofilum reptotaenium CS-1145]|uniref:Prevent-host-death protein n=1 Tax=Roseofilum reptotaenium AO1-A TaxID=1925591 RepID=A0A1L9QU03_9CYAN|nr:prevent-host-death protein [Roseofilum reptotaenium]MDB9518407.1 prevent-host-death protein [Roseofilum reptotaenium CS-1145]OJJ26106.1 prevent-host-death protein [Roseofilum reptotaenium AO1-A]